MAPERGKLPRRSAGFPTWSVLLMVLALAAVTIGAVTYFLDKADRSRRAQITVGSIEIEAQSIYGVPWEGVQLAQVAELGKSAESPAGPAESGIRQPGGESAATTAATWSVTQTKFRALDREIEARIDALERLASDGGPASVRAAYREYVDSLAKLIPYVREGRLVQGYFHYQLKVSPRYEYLRALLAEAGTAYASTARETMARTLAGSALVILLAFGTIGLLFQRSRAKGRRLAEQNERLIELDRMKDSFVAAVSHELRTPLTSILGYMELLEEGDAGELTSEQAQFAAVVTRNAERLLRLVGDLLFVAQTDAGKVSLDRTSVDLADVATESVQAARPFAEDKGVALRLAVEPLPLLWGARARLAQVADNLVSNAVKFTPAGGDVEVRVYSDSRDAVVLELSDTGMGIPAADVGRLFERFYRSSAVAQKAIPGTGLGLSIVKTIVEAHDGTIGIETREGAGTTFRVVLHGSAAAPGDLRAEIPLAA